MATRRTAVALRVAGIFSTELVPVFRFRPFDAIARAVRRAPIRRAPAVALAAIALGAGCRTRARHVAADSSTVVRDDFGDTVPLGRTPARIVSLNPTTTEILFAIGAGDRVVGRSVYDVFPAQAKRVPSVGPALRPNVEAIIAARPDLVILYASEDNRPALARLRAAGITTVGFKIDSIEQFDRDTRLLGRMTNDSARAATLADTVAATLSRVRRATARLSHPTVFVPTWDRPVIAIGGGSYLSELLEIAGAHNVYADVRTPTSVVTLEDVVQRNPDLVLTTPTEAATMRTSPLWRAVPAVRAGHILVYDTTVVSRPSVTLGAAARELANLVHPGAVR